MAVLYEKCGPNHEVHDTVAELVDRYHGDLQVLEVRVGVQFARDPEDPLAAPVKFHGMPALGSVAVVPYRNRVWGLPDAILTLDQYRWRDLGGPEQEALLDTLLEYLEVQNDKDGHAKSDDMGRPKLAVKEPDWYLAGFGRVLARHGAAAVEAVAFRKAAERVPALKQLVLGFADPDPVGGGGGTSVTVSATGPGLDAGPVTLTGAQFEAIGQAAGA